MITRMLLAKAAALGARPMTRVSGTCAFSCSLVPRISAQAPRCPHGEDPRILFFTDIENPANKLVFLNKQPSNFAPGYIEKLKLPGFKRNEDTSMSVRGGP